LDNYRILYIYKDPVEALVSRYGFGHCIHIQGDCGQERDWPKLDGYARAQADRMKLMAHFNSYMHPEQQRKFPIVAVNYHKLWDNLPALMQALGLPESLIQTFPPRTETVRNDLTAAGEKNAAHSEATRDLLGRMYKPLVEEIRQSPAVLVV